MLVTSGLASVRQPIRQALDRVVRAVDSVPRGQVDIDQKLIAVGAGAEKLPHHLGGEETTEQDGRNG